MRLEVRKQVPRRFRLGAVYAKAEVEVDFLNCGAFQRRANKLFIQRGLHGYVRIIRPVSFWRGQRRGEMMVVLATEPIQAPEFVDAIHDTLSEMAAETEAARLRKKNLPAVLVGVQSAGGKYFSRWAAVQAELPDIPSDELSNWLTRKLYEAKLPPGELYRVDSILTRGVDLVPRVVIKSRHDERADEYLETIGSFLKSA